jgi:hypothetical protein
MSLRAFPGSPIPEDTVRVARAAFPKGNRYASAHMRLCWLIRRSLPSQFIMYLLGWPF